MGEGEDEDEGEGEGEVISFLDGSGLPVAGEVSWLRSHASIAERSYVWLGVGVGLRLGSGLGFGLGSGLGFGCGCGLGLPGRPW